jgi:hypothetical protein
MTRNIQDHITEDEFVRFVTEELSKELEIELNRHMEICPNCEEEFVNYYEAEREFPAEKWEIERAKLVADLRKRVFAPSALDRFRRFLREAFFYQLALPASAFDTKQPVDIESEGGAFGVYIEEDKDNVIIVRLDSKETELAGRKIRLYSSLGDWVRVVTLESDKVDSDWVYFELEITREERERLPRDATLLAEDGE